MKHHGQILRQAIKTQRITVEEAARGANISKGTLYQLFAKPNLDGRLLLEIGNAIKYDFSQDLPELGGEEYKAHRKENVEPEGQTLGQEATIAQEEAMINKSREEQQRLLAFSSRLIKEYSLTEEGAELISIMAGLSDLAAH